MSDLQKYPHINIRIIDTDHRPTYGVFNHRTQAKIADIEYYPKWRKYSIQSWGERMSSENLIYIGQFIEDLNNKIKYSEKVNYEKSNI